MAALRGFLAVILLGSMATAVPTYTNPVLDGDHPDPGVLLYNGTYYAVHTSGDAPDAFPMLTSPDLVHWTQVGFVFPAKSPGFPKWAVSDFWAPELHMLNATRFNVYFAARHTDGTLSVGVATGSSPTGPFADLGAPLVHTPGMGNIDASFIQDVDGRTYAIWKRDGNGAQPPVPTPVFVQEVTHGGTLLVGEPHVAAQETLAWEGPLIEGPWIVKRQDYYYLFYSGNGFTSPDYAVGVARSQNVTGPYIKFGPPILHRDTQGGFEGPGHCSVLQTKEGNWVMVYHGWHFGHVGQGGRAMLLDAITFHDNDWPGLDSNNGTPTYTPQPVPDSQFARLPVA